MSRHAPRVQEPIIAEPRSLLHRNVVEPSKIQYVLARAVGLAKMKFLAVGLLACFLVASTTAAPAPSRGSPANFERIIIALSSLVAEFEDVQPSAEPRSEDVELVASAEPLEPSAEPLLIDFDISTDAPEMPYDVEIVDPDSGAPTSVFILLHGLNRTIADVMPIALASRVSLPNTRFIIPQAPKQFVTSAGGEAYSWFDILSTDINGPEADSEIELAAKNIADLAAIQQRELGLNADRIVLVGLSQGGGVATTAYLRYKWGAVVGISTFLPLQNDYPAELSEDSSNAPLLMLHGSEDDVVPVEIARTSVDIMRGLGRTVEYVEYEGEGHYLTNKLIALIADTVVFLKGAGF